VTPRSTASESIYEVKEVGEAKEVKEVEEEKSGDGTNERCKDWPLRSFGQPRASG